MEDLTKAATPPESIRCIDSLATFKLALKEHFKKMYQCYYVSFSMDK